jgi:hypothetical protein
LRCAFCGNSAIIFQIYDASRQPGTSKRDLIAVAAEDQLKRALWNDVLGKLDRIARGVAAMKTLDIIASQNLGIQRFDLQHWNHPHRRATTSRRGPVGLTDIPRKLGRWNNAYLP